MRREFNKRDAQKACSSAGHQTADFSVTLGWPTCVSQGVKL